MVNRTTAPPGEREAIEVSAEEYMEKYAEHHYEWVQGVAYKMSPVSFIHDHFVYYLRTLLEAYFSLNAIATVVGDPFVMDMPEVGSKREPDLQIILKSNPGQLTATAMIGPADICIEVVSPGSVADDYRDKYAEYEQGGVQEYWILDPQKKATRFFRRQSTGMYASMPLDEAGNYTTPLLPRFKLHVPTLWLDELPNTVAVVEAVKAMVSE